MSSWERSRRIPWSKIQQGGDEDPDKHRERVYRELRRETALEEEQRQQLTKTASPAAVAAAATGNAYRYETMDLVKNTVFGLTLGSITGSVFGFMDGMRQATSGESELLKRASSASKGRFLMQGTTRSGVLFGAFFSGFHAIKYGIRIGLDGPGDATEIAVAATASVGGMLALNPAARASLPYASMLVAMDAFHVYMR